VRGKLWEVTTTSSFCARPLGTAVSGNAVFSLAVGKIRSIETEIVDGKELHVTFTLPDDTWMGMGVGTQMFGSDVMVGGWMDWCFGIACLLPTIDPSINRTE
jgi:hypothetical protein